MKKKGPNQRPYTYGRHIRREQDGLLERYGNADLFQEIYLQRALTQRLAARMKAEDNNLTFREFLAGIRTATSSAYCISRLQQMEFVLYDPFIKLAKDLSALLESLNKTTEELLLPFYDENGNLPPELLKYKINPLDEEMETLFGG